jgi:hypothetical protein
MAKAIKVRSGAKIRRKRAVGVVIYYVLPEYIQELRSIVINRFIVPKHLRSAGISCFILITMIIFGNEYKLKYSL